MFSTISGVASRVVAIRDFRLLNYPHELADVCPVFLARPGRVRHVLRVEAREESVYRLLCMSAHLRGEGGVRAVASHVGERGEGRARVVLCRGVDLREIRDDAWDRARRVHIEPFEVDLFRVLRIGVVRAHPLDEGERLGGLVLPGGEAMNGRDGIAFAGDHVVVERQRVGVADLHGVDREPLVANERFEDAAPPVRELRRAVRRFSHGDERGVRGDCFEGAGLRRVEIAFGREGGGAGLEPSGDRIVARARRGGRLEREVDAVGVCRQVREGARVWRGVDDDPRVNVAGERECVMALGVGARDVDLVLAFGPGAREDAREGRWGAGFGAHGAFDGGARRSEVEGDVQGGRARSGRWRDQCARAGWRELQNTGVGGGLSRGRCGYSPSPGGEGREAKVAVRVGRDVVGRIGVVELEVRPGGDQCGGDGGSRWVEDVAFDGRRRLRRWGLRLCGPHRGPGRRARRCE